VNDTSAKSHEKATSFPAWCRPTDADFWSESRIGLEACRFVVALSLSGHIRSCRKRKVESVVVSMSRHQSHCTPNILSRTSSSSGQSAGVDGLRLISEITQLPT